MCIYMCIYRYVLMQEVPKTVDRNPKTTTYLWHVSLPHAYSTLEAEILKMVSHLHIRLRHECSTLPAEGAADGDDVAAMRASAKVDCLEHTLTLPLTLPLPLTLTLTLTLTQGRLPRAHATQAARDAAAAAHPLTRSPSLTGYICHVPTCASMCMCMYRAWHVLTATHRVLAFWRTLCSWSESGD